MTVSLGPSHVPRSRQDLKERLFDVIDKDGDDMLNTAEMRELAKLVGFDGGDEEWSQEYLKLCDEVGASPVKGIPKVVVLELLDDRSETGCFCTEEDLQILLRGLEKREVKATSSKMKERKSKQLAKSREGNSGDNMVFFQGVPLWTTEDAIRSFFQRAGEVLSIRLFRLKDGTSRGMGYVTYASNKQASKAVRVLNQDEMDGHHIEVYAFDHQEEKRRSQPSPAALTLPPDSRVPRPPRPARPAPQQGSSYEGWYGGEDHGPWYSPEWEGSYPANYDYGDSYGYQGYEAYEGYANRGNGRALYFVGAPFDMMQDKLRQIFQEYGSISRFWLFRLPDGRSRGQGLVEYSHAEEARYAIHYLHGRRLGERTLKVQEDQVGALDQHAYEESFQGPAPNHAWWDTRSVFFSGAPSLTPFRVVQSYFEEFGEVEHFNMFRHSNGKARGMGVVTFVRAETAIQVLMSSIEVDGWHLFLKEADQQPGRPARPAAGRNQYDEWSGGWEQSYPSKVPKVKPEKSLYFANVAYESTETVLRNRFAKFGSIKTLHMLRTKDGHFKGKGLVEYSNAASVTRAYNSLHEAVFNGRRMVLDEVRPDVDYNAY